MDGRLEQVVTHHAPAWWAEGAAFDVSCLPRRCRLEAAFKGLKRARLVSGFLAVFGGYLFTRSRESGKASTDGSDFRRCVYGFPLRCSCSEICGSSPKAAKFLHSARGALAPGGSGESEPGGSDALRAPPVPCNGAPESQAPTSQPARIRLTGAGSLCEFLAGFADFQLGCVRVGADQILLRLDRPPLGNFQQIGRQLPPVGQRFA